MQDTLIRNLSGHQGGVNCVRFTHDGTYCMSASSDRTVKLWNPHKPDSEKSQMPNTLEQATCVYTFSGVHGYAVLDLTISEDKGRFASAGEDKTCFLWDVATNRVIRRIQAHNHRTNGILFNKDATILFTGSYDKTVKCWDLRSNNREPIQVISDFQDSVTSLAMSDYSLFTSCVDGKARIYDMRFGCMNVDHHFDPIGSISLSKDQKTYLASCLSNKIRLMEIETGMVLKEYIGHLNCSFKTESYIETDLEHIISGSEDGSIFHWELLSGKMSYATPRAHTKGISGIAYHPEKNEFLTSSYDGNIKFWSSSSTRLVKN